MTTEREDIHRIDLQLIAMIEAARVSLAESGLKADERVLIQGFFASAMFANRFAILHPDMVKVTTIGSPGGWPIAPVASFEGQPLNYPAGIADLESLAGIPFDAETYKAIPQLIYMGSADDNDSLDFTDGWDEADAGMVDDLFGADPLHVGTMRRPSTNMQGPMFSPCWSMAWATIAKTCRIIRQNSSRRH